ncbi:MAG: hypothetical protein ACRD0A_09155 [Acidimicrobiales bacterium]
MITVVAHGVGARGDLPLPLWMFAYAASFALLISFAALGLLWPKPRLEAAAAGVALPGWVQRAGSPLSVVGRIVGLAVLLLTFLAAVFGQPDAAANVAPYIVYVVFWVGIQFAVAVLGDIWRSLNPLDTLALLFRMPETAGRTPRTAPGWTAAVMLLSFAWLELAYYEPSDPRVVGLWMGSYTVAALIGAGLWGRGWLRVGEGFAVIFGLLAALAPLYRDPVTAELRVRAPVSGLARAPVRRGITAVILVTLGSTTFDGVTRTGFWLDLQFEYGLVGWKLTAVNTAGLIVCILAVTVAFGLAIGATAAITDRPVRDLVEVFSPSLIPIVLAYAVAHYFSLLVFESQTAIALASDPFGRGGDLFGTVDWVPDYNALSPAAIAWVQVIAIVVGHVLGVLSAHDRAVERFSGRLAMRSQLPLVAVMVVFTVAGLTLLLGA